MTVVLFACVHNAGRSQMAAAWFDAIADGSKARAISAGTQPASRVHPEVAAVMREVGVESNLAAPQPLTEAVARRAQILVTMGCGEVCPVVAGVRRIEWQIDDPKGQPIERVRAIRDVIRTQVQHLVAAEGWQRRA